MGCGGSSAAADVAGSTGISPSRAHEEAVRGDSRISTCSDASELSVGEQERYHRRLIKLKELDDTTKIPFILVELRGCGDHDGWVEVCGKDEYGVYEALGHFLESKWKCKLVDTILEHTGKGPVPFCDSTYRWKGYTCGGGDGASNMGLSTMALVDFMCNTLCWTLGVVNGGNVGARGEIREQQVIFKAPHPMNMVAKHLMIELRSAGYIEVCGADRASLDTLHFHLLEKYKARPLTGHECFSHRFYSCGNKVFQERGKSGENNIGQLTVEVCDAVVKLLPGWSLVALNGGNYGEEGTHREQQLVFRCDHHPLRESPHVMVEMREAGYIEVCGQDVGKIHETLAEYFATHWECKEDKGSSFCDRKFRWKTKGDFMVAAAELTCFFHERGWQMQVCSQGTVKVKGNPDSREQQMLFRPGASGHGVVEPHIFFELYTGETDESISAKKNATQVLGNQFIRLKSVGDCAQDLGKVKHFLENYLGGILDENEHGNGVLKYWTDCFLTRGLTDNNLGAWTMRFCDFMVDRLGWSFVVCNVCNLGDKGQIREQQLVFRFDGARREIPPVRLDNDMLDWTAFPGLDFPHYWKNQDVLNLRKTFKTESCTPEEISCMQRMFDHTYKRILTRDRVYEYQLGHAEEMPYRLEVVHAFRSEHAELFRRFNEVSGPYTKGEQVRAKTSDVPDCGLILNRLRPGEAYLAHATNPSSAMGILKTGFALNHAGKTTGTMFGYGIYLAECVSKSDEYARDDNGGTYPGLMAMLICRCLVGKPLVKTDAGDFVDQARAGGYNSLIGDRETKVGTYREFVFFDERQVYPEYTVIYRRQYEQEKVPELFRQGTRGTTGRNWQVQLDKGWANVPPDVSHRLNELEASGKKQIQISIADIPYVFDLAQMRQKNLQTGKERGIRPPMRR